MIRKRVEEYMWHVLMMFAGLFGVVVLGQDQLVLFGLATLQYSVSLRTAQSAAIETTIGAAPQIEFWSGALPANCAAAATGTLLARGDLPSDWLAAAAAGAVAKTGTWTFNGVAAGTIGYFRINRAGSPSECDIQGDVTVTAGGGAMTVDNTNIAVAQQVTVTGFTITRANA